MNPVSDMNACSKSLGHPSNSDGFELQLLLSVCSLWCNHAGGVELTLMGCYGRQVQREAWHDEHDAADDEMLPLLILHHDSGGVCPFCFFHCSLFLCFVSLYYAPPLHPSVILTKLSERGGNTHITSTINHHGQMELMALRGQMHHFPPSIILIFH